MENVSVIYLITLKLGADLFAVTMFVELRAASLSRAAAAQLGRVRELKTRRVSACANNVLFTRAPALSMDLFLPPSKKHCVHRLFLNIYLSISHYSFQPKANYDYYRLFFF